jgi:glycosyltransferase involved in cell wall biosynthesis
MRVESVLPTEVAATRRWTGTGPVKKRIAFISTLEGWGGSEELWSQTALDLVAHGLPVTASVYALSPLPQRVRNLMQGGVEVWLRPSRYPVWKQAWRKVFASEKTWVAMEVEKFLAVRPPTLVVLSDWGPMPPVELLELFVSKSVPFVTISQANWEGWWPPDELAHRYRKVIPGARRCYFVSKGNQRLLEKQIGCELPNAEVVYNPINVNVHDALPPWPSVHELHLACVARLYPPSKGQDLLLEALADPVWNSRKWRLTLCGEGPQRHSLERMVDRLGLKDRVTFAGWVESVRNIWVENHVLVMPSRGEGLPLAMVEAMTCARPVVATDVGGNSEIIEDGVTGFLADAPTASSIRKALERLWDRRMCLETIGKAAAERIRQKVPADPVRAFSERIKCLA